MAGVKPLAARVLLAAALCFLALQWLGAASAADVAHAGPAGSHAEASLPSDKSPCDGSHRDCDAAHPCVSILPEAYPPFVAVPASERMAEKRLRFADHFPSRSLPPPLAVLP